MAIIKHIKIKNSNYDAATDYLTFKHDEFTNKPILDEHGNMIPREDYPLDGINCDPFNFGRECEALNAQFKKNQSRKEIKAHHYIISFDPRDKDENGLTAERAQELGKEFATKNFPGHQTIICTHPDGHNSAGNIKRREAGITPNKTEFETDNGFLRRVITSALEDSNSMEDFQKKLFEKYGIAVHESRGRISYKLLDKDKPIRGRQLGTNFEKKMVNTTSICRL